MILGQFPTIKDENARIWEEKKVTQINVFFKNLGAQVGIDSMLVETTWSRDYKARTREDSPGIFHGVDQHSPATTGNGARNVQPTYICMYIYIYFSTLQGTNIFHLGKGKIIFKSDF